MSKKTGWWNGYDLCESDGGVGKKWGRFGSVEKFGKDVVRRVCCLSGVEVLITLGYIEYIEGVVRI